MAISIKFITSNFKQNANNYFENLLGECANLRARGIKFGHFVVFRDKIPYFERSKEIKHWEILEDRDMNKYIKLFEERGKFLHVPNFICVEVVSISPLIEEFYNRKPKFTEMEIPKCLLVKNGIDNTNLSEEVKNFLKRNLDLCHFFMNIKKTLA